MSGIVPRKASFDDDPCRMTGAIEPKVALVTDAPTRCVFKKILGREELSVAGIAGFERTIGHKFAIPPDSSRSSEENSRI